MDQLTHQVFPTQSSGGTPPVNNSGNKIYFSGGVILGIIVIIGSWYYFYSSQASPQRPNPQREILEKLYDAGLTGDTQIIKDYEKELQKEWPPEIKAELKRTLGIADYYYGDREKGSSLLKETVLDASYPPIYRARAMVNLLRLATLSGDDEEVRTYVFSGGEPFESFYKEGNIQEAIRRAYEFADSIYPNARSKYNIAFWYGNKLFEDKLAKNSVLTPDERATYLDTFKALVKEGDDAFSQEVIYLRSSPPYTLSFYTSVQARAHSLRFIITGKKEAAIVSKELYEQSMRYIEDNHDFLIRQAVFPFVRLSYASFLAWLTTEGIENHAETVRTLLAPIIQENEDNKEFFTYLKNAHKSADTISKELIQRIGRIDSNFSRLLLRLGWPISL